jgi:hypothetical protein
MSDTTITPLSQSTWTAIGTAPALLAAYAGDMVVVLAAEQPAAASVAGFVIRCTAGPVAITQTGAMWALGLAPLAQAVVQV